MYIFVEIQKDMQKFITLFIFACIICSCEKSDNKPSQPRYLVLTRTVKMLPTEYQKGKEMKEVYTYNDFGYEDSFILYVDGETWRKGKITSMMNRDEFCIGKLLPRMGGKG